MRAKKGDPIRRTKTLAKKKNQQTQLTSHESQLSQSAKSAKERERDKEKSLFAVTPALEVSNFISRIRHPSRIT